jgi:hypothetical protein
MLRYENKGNCIEVLLPNSDYSVFAVYATTSTTDKINVTLFLKEKSIGDLRFMDSQEITSERNEIKTNVARIVGSMIDTGEIDDYISKYEYELKCFETGYEIDRNKTK